MALYMVDDVCSVNERNSASVEANAIINVKMEEEKIEVKQRQVCPSPHWKEE